MAEHVAVEVRLTFKKSVRTRIWTALRRATFFLRGTPLQPVWSWLWHREFDSLIRDVDARASDDVERPEAP